MRTGPRPVAPRPARQSLAVEAVERVAHRPEPGRPSRRGPPRASEGRARFERPGERVRADPDPDPGRVVRVDLGLGEEVARVDEAEAVGLAVRPRSSSAGCRAMNGLCWWLDAPRSLPTDWRPGRSGGSTTWFSRAHAPLSWTNSQRASGRSRVGAHGAGQADRRSCRRCVIRALRATTGRSRKIV